MAQADMMKSPFASSQNPRIVVAIAHDSRNLAKLFWGAQWDSKGRPQIRARRASLRPGFHLQHSLPGYRLWVDFCY